jgi:two-component system nitrogen regulation response regulator GlnG
MTAKVWIVDDDSSIRWVLRKRTLGSEGFAMRHRRGEALLSSLEMRSRT